MLTSVIIMKIFLTSLVCTIVGGAILHFSPDDPQDVPLLVQLITVILFFGGIIGIIASVIMSIWVLL